jgi:hypothetical protein
MIRLFEDFERTRAGRANHDSSQFDFLDTSSWKAASYVRDKVNEWAKTFPLDNDFIARFTSADNKEHIAAFFELVMFNWFKLQNFEVDFQGIALASSSRRPDFTLSRNDSKLFIAECTLSALPGNDLGTEKLEKQITDVIESIPSPKYFVNVDFEKSSQESIPKKKIVNFLEGILQEGQAPADFLKNRKEWVMEESGWIVKFSLLPKSAETTRTLGITMHGAFQFINSERPLRTALDRKRGRSYGTLEIPFVICVNSSDFYLDEISIVQTLFGTAGELNTESLKDSSAEGFLNYKGKPQNTSVAAVLILKGLVPWNLHAVKAELWHNPWAAFPLSTELLNVDQYFFKKNEVNTYERKIFNGRTFGEILDIDPDYLSQEVE